MITVTASDARPIDTGVARGVDVDVRVTFPDGRTLDGEVTLLPALQGRPRYESWGQPGNWIDGRLLTELQKFDGIHFREACDVIEEAASIEAGTP